MTFDRKEWAAVFILLFTALAVRVALLPQIKVLLPDETFYVGMAASLGEGRAYAGFDGHPFQKSVNTEGRSQGQPLVPLLFSAAGQVFGKQWELAAQWTNLLAFLLTVLAFYAAVRTIGNKKEAFFSALLLVLAPFSIRYSLLAMTHAVFIFFLTAFFLCALKMLMNGKTRWAISAGVCLCGAYATRVEAFFLWSYVSLLGMAAICLFKELRRFAVPWLGGIITFAVLSLPLLIWIRQTTGQWQLDWDLSDRAGSFLQFWNGPGPSLHDVPALYLKRLLDVWNSMMRQFPLPVCILIALGLFEISLRGRAILSGLCLLLAVCLFHFLFYPLVGRDLRFYHPAMVLLLMMVGPGMTFLEQRIRSVKWLWGGVAFLCLASFLPGYRSLVLTFREEPFEMRRLGEWVRDNEASPKSFLGSDRRPCYYAGPACGRFAGFREVDSLGRGASGLETFLNEQKIDFVVVDTRYLSKFYPDYAFLLKEPPASLQKITQAEAWGESAVLLGRGK